MKNNWHWLVEGLGIVFVIMLVTSKTIDVRWLWSVCSAVCLICSIQFVFVYRRSKQKGYIALSIGSLFVALLSATLLFKQL